MGKFVTLDLKNTVLHHNQAEHYTVIMLGYLMKEDGEKTEYKVRKATLTIYCCLVLS
jgi:hypothetical protein